MWALIVVSCMRVCTPQYVELYTTKEACMAQENTGGWPTAQTKYCRPAVAIKEK